VTSHRDFIIGIAVGVVLTVALLGVVVWLTMRWVRRRVSAALQPARARSLQGWDYRMRLRTLDGDFVDAESFRERTLFLNFWAPWCAPCVAELPSIERLVARLEGTGVAFACVTTEPLDKVKAFAAHRHLKLPIYVLPDETPPIFETRSIPATFIVRNGDVISQHIGAARWDTEEVVALLTAAPPSTSASLRWTFEQRLPAVEPPWTHWRLFGDGDTESFIADIPVEDVAGAVRAVAASYRNFRRVDAELIRFANDGSCVLSKRRAQIASPQDRDS
jgi:thiol-disulfide isomerase/thioredoxin